jgi:hypothetical protein
MPKTPIVVFIAAVLLALGAVLAPTRALAGGSISLEDALAEIFVASPPLVAEIDAAVKREGRPTADITCDADIRLGGAWEHLSATRVVPIECEIAGKTLRVDGKVTFRDAKGRVLTEIGPKMFRRAVKVEQTDLTWTWTSAPPRP